MLLAQSSNYLLGQLAQLRRGKEILSPLGSATFMKRFDDILAGRVPVSDITSPEGVLAAYDWLVCYLIDESDKKLKQLLRSGMDEFTAKQKSQVYFCRTLSIAYLERVVIDRFYHKVFSEEMPDNIRDVSRNLYLLYALWSLEKHQATLFQGGFLKNGQDVKRLREEILRLCNELKPDIVTLVDAVAPPDWVVRAPIGLSDGKPLENLCKNFLDDPDKQKRVYWWEDILNKKEDNMKSKL